MLFTKPGSAHNLLATAWAAACCKRCACANVTYGLMYMADEACGR